MARPFNVSGFRTRLLAWYDRNQRPLPWRKTTSPYRIWVSEIMLQQTRVAAITERYREFLKRFPTLLSLAQAREADVLAAWSGLGYYRRARSLRDAARVIVKQHRGKIPHELAELKELPGIGDYTAAAIASIAFGKPHAVVDGNVHRVLTRVMGKPATSTSCWKDAQQLLSPNRPGDFNQAMMELGATVCVPMPKCDACPVFAMCATQGIREKAGLPKPARHIRVRLALSVRDQGVYLVQRPKSAAIMPAMWELPLAKQRTSGNILKLKHSITTTNYSVEVFQNNGHSKPSGGRWIAIDRLAKLPLTGLARKVLHRAGIL